MDEAAAAEIAADAVIALKCNPITINAVSDPPSSIWAAPPSTGGDDSSDVAATTTALPAAVAIRRSGGIVRAWRDTPPKHLTSATEAEQRRLLGAVYTKPTSHEQPQAHRRAADGTWCGGGLLGERVQGGPGRLPGGAHRDVLGARESQSMPGAIGSITPIRHPPYAANNNSP